MTARVRLAAEYEGQHADGGFSQLGGRLASGQSCSHGSFECAEEAFHCPSLSVAPLTQMLSTHLSPPVTVAPAISSLAIGNYQTFDSPILPAPRMDPLGVVAGISQ